MSNHLHIEPATERDVPVILSMIRALAEYERLSHEVSTSEAGLRNALFGATRSAEVLLGYVDADADAQAVALAVFFHNFSTFLGKPGLYLEDLFVRPEWRGRGFGRQMLTHLARIAVDRGCGRMEWSVLDWNEQAIGFYRRLGATALDNWTVHRVTGDALRALAERQNPGPGTQGSGLGAV